jgi:hypothetical protein
MEFCIAYEKSLKNHKGVNFFEYTKSLMNVLSKHFSETETIGKTQKKHSVEENYKPKGKHEKQFLSILCNTLSELS